MRLAPGGVTAGQGLAALLVGILLGVGFGWLVSGDGGQSTANTTTSRAAAPADGAPLPEAGGDDGEAEKPEGKPRSDADRRQAARLRKTLARASIAAPNGTIDVALMLDDWRDPIFAGSRRNEVVRPWSLVKAVTALTLLNVRLESGAATQDLADYLQRSLQRSDNCAQRYITLKLKEDLANDTDRTIAAVQDTVSRAGARLDTRTVQRSQSGSSCVTPDYVGLPKKMANDSAPLLGTSGWTLGDSARFFHAVRSTDVYGEEASQYMLEVLRMPKQNSQEPGADEQLTSPPTWGAGTTFAGDCWDVAYKSGWGGSAQKRFIATQMGSVELENGRWAAFALIYRPAAQPVSDDPGAAGADKGVEAGLGALKRGLEAEFGAGGCG